jgi:hypothetical protein
VPPWEALLPHGFVDEGGGCWRARSKMWQEEGCLLREVWAMAGSCRCPFKGRWKRRPSIWRGAPSTCHLWRRRSPAVERQD